MLAAAGMLLLVGPLAPPRVAVPRACADPHSSPAQLPALPLGDAWYRACTTRRPLLTAERELELGRQVQQKRQLEAIRNDLGDRLGRLPTLHEWAVEAELDVAEIEAQCDMGAAAAREFVESNMRLVYMLAAKYTRHRGSGTAFLFEDLAQEGTLGLMRAVQTFDPSKGLRFTTYVWNPVRNAIIDALNSASTAMRVPAHVHVGLHKIKRLQETHGGAMTESELATSIGMSERRVRSLLKASTSATKGGYRTIDAFRPGTTSPLLDVLPSRHAPPEERVARDDEWRRIWRAIDRTLNENEKKILLQRYGLWEAWSKTPHGPEAAASERTTKRRGGTPPTPTPTPAPAVGRGRHGLTPLQSIAQGAGVSPSCCQQVIGRALVKLRASGYADELRETLEGLDEYAA